MNLHIVPDNSFINRFYSNLEEAGVQGNNRLVVRTNNRTLKTVRYDFPFAKPYTAGFDEIVGDTMQYDRVFVHQFSPLLYRWVATHEFRELGWMIWGADLYNLPFVDAQLYEPLTHQRFVAQRWSMNQFLYRAKVWLLHARHRHKAFRTVKSILTWMTSEYDFAASKLPGLSAEHRFFFYENEVPYHDLDNALRSISSDSVRRKPLYIVGNSATPELNHLDVIQWMEENEIQADLVIPVSYGDMDYARFLTKSRPSYRHGRLEYVSEYLSFDSYVQLLASADGLIMNNIRPQGYGNILMMMYLGKQVFLNPRNLSVPELDAAGLLWSPISEMGTSRQSWSFNRERVLTVLSHEKLIRIYRELFG